MLLIVSHSNLVEHRAVPRIQHEVVQEMDHCARTIISSCEVSMGMASAVDAEG